MTHAICEPIIQSNDPLGKREIAILCRIRFEWDKEAMGWIAIGEDVPGLVLESGSLDALVERVKQAYLN